MVDLDSSRGEPVDETDEGKDDGASLDPSHPLRLGLPGVRHLGEHSLPAVSLCGYVPAGLLVRVERALLASRRV